MANHRVSNVVLDVENTYRDAFHYQSEGEGILDITDDVKAMQWIESSQDWSLISESLRVRIEGMVKTCKGFTRVIHMSQIIPQEVQGWPALVLGSLAFCVREIMRIGDSGRNPNPFLPLTEELTTNTYLPLSPFNLPCTDNISLAELLSQLFAELVLSLQKLALFIHMNPAEQHRRERPSEKFIQFSIEHQGAVSRLRSWCNKVRECTSSYYTATRTASPRPNQKTSEASIRGYESIPGQISKYFQGREGYLMRIQQTFATSPARPALVSLYGLPGIGKTQLAMRFCKSRAAHYKFILWTEADTPMKTQEALSRHSIKLRLPGATSRGDSALNGRILLEWLEATDDTWLLVYDNLNNIQLLRQFWPEGGKGHIIVTSRDPYTAGFRSCASISVSPLDMEESVNLFYDEVGSSQSPQRNPRIEKLLGEWKGVPLAINQMSGFITRSGMDLDDFVDLYYKDAPRLLQRDHLYQEYPHSVATAFATEQLQQDPKTVIHAMCFFDPDRVPGEVIQSSFNSAESQGSISTVRHMDYIDSLETLFRMSLLTHFDKNISIHRLVQEVVYLFMSPGDRQRAFDSVLSALSNSFPKETGGQMWKDWHKCERYLPHAIFLCRRYEHDFRGQKSIRFAALVSSVAWYLFERGLFAELESLVHIGLAACPDEESLVTASVIWPLVGIVLENNRITEGLPLLLKSLKIRESLLPTNDPMLCVTYYSVGISYMEDNQLEKSLEYNLKALEVGQKCGDPDEGPLAFTYGNLGLIYRRMGELEKGSECMEKGEELWRRSYGTESDRYAVCMYYLGNLRLDQGRIAEAQKCHQTSFNISCKILPHNFKTGLYWHKMATYFRRDGNFSQAESYVRRAMSIFEKCFDPVPRLARSTYLLSEVLRDSGRIPEADEVRQEAERLRKEITTLPYEEDSSFEAFERLVPYFLR